jgi:dTDP-4-amino-4,6-dideoxygalactose transaminase
MYYVLLADAAARPQMLSRLNAEGVNAVAHYVPLHLSPGGQRFGRSVGSMDVTTSIADRLVRLPLWAGMTDDEIAAVTESVESWAASLAQ